MTFGGWTYDESRDGDRLRRQLADVWKYMHDGDWHTLYEISEATGHPMQSISARLRDFRKPKFGKHTLLAEYVRRGLWRYKLLPNISAVTPATPPEPPPPEHR